MNTVQYICSVHRKAMTTAARRSREKEELRASILNAAKKLFLEKGVEKTTIRNIADKIEYSPGTVYVYFKDKDEILSGLHTIGFQALKRQFLPLMQVGDPMERLKAIGKIYIEYSIQNPEMYELMFSMKAPMAFLQKIKEDEWHEGKATFEILRSTVEECLQKRYFQDHNLDALTYMIWGTVHGICDFNCNGRIQCVMDVDPIVLVRQSYNEFTMILDKI
ncbi:MAG: TetR/AcrR family transcriptional regulator [Bacteroidota bacterium]